MFGKRFCFRQNMTRFIKERATRQTEKAQVKALSLFASGQKTVILGTLCGQKAGLKLEGLGLLPGTGVKILVNSGHGPLLVQVENSRVTLGRGLATSIQAYGLKSKSRNQRHEKKQPKTSSQTWEQLMTLKKILPGQTCMIQAINAQSALGQRLFDLGLVPGQLVKVLRNAPLNDPVELEIDGYLISLRREEAGCVAVEASHG